MFQGLYTNESGMNSFQTGFDVISNNIANINSIGFKKSDTVFSDLFNKTYKTPQININPLQAGLGTAVADIREILTPGNYQTTNNATDMAIFGNGYFIMKNGVDKFTYYTKAGSFYFDPGKLSDTDGSPQISSDGKINYYLGNPTLVAPMNLVNSDGAFVQGWNADSKGNINSSSSVENIIIDKDKFNMPASATTKASLENNLNSTLGITQFNKSNISVSKYNGIAIDSNSINGLINIRGNAFESRAGEYEININPDGSALVKFTPADGTAENIYEFSTGTIPTDAASDIKTTELIPGIEMTIGKDITKPIYAKISNSGYTSGDSYNTEATVYDETGEAHNLLFTFNRIDTNQWVWEARLYEIENFTGTGSAATFTTANEINLEKNISVKIKNSSTNTVETIPMSDLSVFEGNKIAMKRTLGENETAEVTYFSAEDDTQKTETFSAAEIAESFALDNIPDADSIEIYVDGSSEPLSSNYYEVHNNFIVPVDTNGDGIKDEPFVGTGVNVKIKYISADSIATTVRKNKDVYNGTGKIEEIPLANDIDTNSPVSIIVTNKSTGASRTLSLNDFEVQGHLLKPKDTNNDGILDSPVINENEILTIEYSVKDTPINQTEILTYDGTTNLKLSGQPRPGTLILYNEDNSVISSDKYVVANNKVIFIDADKNGSADLPGAAGAKIKAVYDIDFPEKINLNFNADGEMAGGSDLTTLKFDTKNKLSIAVDMSNIFQFAGYSDASIGNIDGNKQGVLQSIGVDENGNIKGYYSNDITRTIAKVALATFNNPQDLTSVGEGYYINNSNTVEAKISDAGINSVGGTILSKYLENSNVDLATEFSNLIVLQRSYQLNARGISTISDMISAAINTKR